MHVASKRWGEEPERHSIPLDFTPGHDAIAFSTPSFLVIRAVGSSTYMPDVMGVDPLTGKLLWRFSDEVGPSIILHCHSEFEQRIVATTPKGVYLLEREGPRLILDRKLEATSVGRFNADGTVGFAVDSDNRLVAFSNEGDILWDKRPRSRRRFQNPFPLDNGGVVISGTEDILCLNAEGERVWTWAGVSQDTPHANRQSRYSIATYVPPNLLLVRSVEETTTHHLVLDAHSGEYLGHLGDVWPYGADGVVHQPVVLQNDKEQVAFLKDDGTISEPQKLKSMLGAFLKLPEGLVALHYDVLMKMIACTDAEGKILWRESYPDAEGGLAAISFMEHAAFFVTTKGNLHVWDFYPESDEEGTT